MGMFFAFGSWFREAGPELPGLGEEIPELNLFSQYAVYHDEGEIAAKLFVPARQIEYVENTMLTLHLWGRP